MDTISTERLVGDLRSIIADTEHLLRATADHAGEKIGQVRARAERSVREAREHLHDTESRLVDRARVAARRTDRYVHSNPWSAIGVAAGITAGVAFVIGFLAARR